MQKFSKLSRTEMKKVNGGGNGTCNVGANCQGSYFDGRGVQFYQEYCRTGDSGCGCYDSSGIYFSPDANCTGA